MPGPVLTPVGALLLAGALSAAAPRAAFSDPFLDGSARRGPDLRAFGETSCVIGSRPDEPGFHPMQVPHRVTLSPFAIGAYEVTNAEIAEFLRDEGNPETEGVPAVLAPPAGVARVCLDGGTVSPEPGAERLPAVSVSWPGARAFCRWLSEKTGRRYDLPTAAQWECAARAGTATTWPWGDDDEAGRHPTRGATRGGTEPFPVGSFPPNAWGLYDMTGNVWEWVLDCFELDFYFHSPERDPVALDGACLAPEIRGGSFRDRGDFCRPGYRANTWWYGGYDALGFRVARALEPDEVAALGAGAARKGSR